MNIRFATEADEARVVALMQAADECVPGYRYQDLDGWCLIAEDGTRLLGYTWFDLGHPDTCLRSWAVEAPGLQQALVANRLLTATQRLAQHYGSQGLWGFAPKESRAKLYAHGGASVQPGWRVRWNFTPYVHPQVAATSRG